MPILKGSPEIIKTIREKLYQPDFQDLTVVDFSDLAQGCKTYDEFISKMGNISESALQYFGLAICGSKKSKQTHRQYATAAVEKAADT